MERDGMDNAAGASSSRPGCAPLQAPFPWFGGKRRVADVVWQRFGAVANYVEPFFGSGAVLLGAPTICRTETVNDYDGYVANFWRAVKSAPEEVAEHADNPVNENDLHARHVWLIEQRESLTARLDGDPDFFDAKIAGWWCWGLCCWIGGSWCMGKGPWRVVLDDEGRRRLVKGDAGRGVQRRLVHLNRARGVKRNADIYEWLAALGNRLSHVRVCCGDWSRVCGPTPTVTQGLTGVFLDPPYADTAERTDRLYRCDSTSIAHDVREWCIANGDSKLLRIALCGYEGEHQMPESWECYAWKAHGGYANISTNETAGDANKLRERIWFSPHCLRDDSMPLFAGASA